MTRLLAAVLALLVLVVGPVLVLWSVVLFAGWALGLTEAVRVTWIALAWDRLLNAATGGTDRETVSSRAARARDDRRPWACWLCQALDALDPDHCNQSRGI